MWRFAVLFALFTVAFAKKGSLCDPSDEKNCDENYKCVPDALLKTGRCECIYNKMICGSNGKTYNDFCELVEEAMATDNASLVVQSYGRCIANPEIIAGPESTKNKTGDFITLSCEAIGNPIPIIFWFFTQADGTTKPLPSDDSAVAVNMRGGPDSYRITGFVQIMEASKRHEGDYTCVAVQMDMPTQSKAEATARVKIMEDDVENS